MWTVGCLGVVQHRAVQRNTVHNAGVDMPPRLLGKVTAATSRAQVNRTEQGSYPGMSRDVRLVSIKALSWSMVTFPRPFWASLGLAASGAASERAQVGLDEQPSRPQVLEVRTACPDGTCTPINGHALHISHLLCTHMTLGIGPHDTREGKRGWHNLGWHLVNRLHCC